jgi:methylisocitrate lyase
MNKAALAVYETILDSGTQVSAIGAMQTREDLYEVLGYHAYEKKLDDLFAEKEKK